MTVGALAEAGILCGAAKRALHTAIPRWTDTQVTGFPTVQLQVAQQALVSCVASTVLLSFSIDASKQALLFGQYQVEPPFVAAQAVEDRALITKVVQRRLEHVREKMVTFPTWRLKVETIVLKWIRLPGRRRLFWKHSHGRMFLKGRVSLVRACRFLRIAL
eukprot:gene1498-biopygen7974